MNHRIEDLVIAIGTSESNIIAERTLQGVQGLLICAPAVLAETVNVQVSNDGGTSWALLRRAAVDILLAAGKADGITEPGLQLLRLKSTVNVAAARTFNVSIQELEN